MTAARRTSPLATVRSAGPLRLALAMLGLLVIAYGGLRLVQDAKDTKPLQLAVSIIGIAVLHDAVIAPLTVAVGWLVTRLVRPRARAYVQGGLAVAGIITLMSLPLIHRQGRSGPGSALLTQNYTRNLVVLLVLIALVTAGAYAL
ncbi:MAG: hypothetical protein ABJA87_14040, partial [bacterium]